MLSDSFKLRWRVKDGKVLLFNRHIRELSSYDLTPALIAWVHERLEWAAMNLLTSDTDAVLVLSVDPQTEIQLALEDTQPLPQLGAKGTEHLVLEQGKIKGLQLSEGSMPATVWLVLEEGMLVASSSELTQATDTLVAQLAATQEIKVTIAPQEQKTYETARAVFALSDEFGFVPLRGSSDTANRIAANLATLY